MSETIVVQPREIHDYVYRATRLTGADHGLARIVARSASTADDLEDHLAALLQQLEAREAPAVDLSDPSASRSPGGSGRELPVALWRRLTACAGAYLVSESRLDGVE